MALQTTVEIIIWLTCYTVKFISCNELEVCQREWFNASCHSGEVILLTSARYGRMRTGRCMPDDFGQSGCYEDVIFQLDEECSGQSSCSVPVPGEALSQISPCPRGLEAYLLAEYTCVKVNIRAAKTCKPQQHNEIQARNSGFLTNTASMETGYISAACPIVLRAKPGQRFNISVWDFSGPLIFSSSKRSNEILMNPQPSICERYATLSERVTGTQSQPTGNSIGGAGKDTVVCQDRYRWRQVAITNTNVLEITMPNPWTRNSARFLLQYEVIGCEPIVAPIYGWVQLYGDRATLGCNSSHERWYLTCDKSIWIGTFRNCSNYKAVEESVNLWFTIDHNHWSTPVGILVVTALGIVLGLVLGVFLLAVAVTCIKKRRCACFYGNHSYEEAKLTHCDAHGVYYGPKPPNTSAAIMRENIEMVNANENNTALMQKQQYGTMAVLSYKPPSYTTTGRPGTPTSTQGSVRSVRKLERLRDCLSSSNDLQDTSEELA